VANASKLTVTVSGVTEANYDYMYIYDANGNEIKKLHGNINETFTVNSGSIRARFTSDRSQVRSGVTVTVVDASNDATWSTGTYTNNEDRNQTLSVANASKLTVTVSGVTEANYDYMYIYDANGNEIKKLHGNINETFTVNSGSIRARFTSDHSQVRSGVTVTVIDRPTSTCTLNTNIIKGNTFENTNDLSHWNTTSGTANLVRANYSTGWAGTTPANAGANFLYATGGNTVVVEQTIDISDCVNSNTSYDFSTLLGGYGDSDSVRVRLDFKDVSDTTLESYDTQEFTSSKVMTAFDNTAPLPNTITKVTVTLTFTKHGGGADIDGYVDNLSLRIQNNGGNTPDTTKPILTLNGESNITITVGNAYIDAGATATDNVDGNITSNIITSGTVDTNTAGTYTLTYTVSDVAGNSADRVTRTVNIVQSNEDVLIWTTGAYENNQRLTQRLTVPNARGLIVTFRGETEAWKDVVWFKDTDGNTISVIKKNGRTGKWLSGVLNEEFIVEGSFIEVNFQSGPAITKSGVTVTVRDANGATPTTLDTTAPVILLLGNSPQILTVGDTYTDAGVTATDNRDRNITALVVATSTVDSSTAGEYNVRYIATDVAGNKTVLTRIVVVTKEADSSKPVITLNGYIDTIIAKGSTYKEKGATAFDDRDGNITANMTTTSTVDTTTEGTYTVTYNINDIAGNSADEVTRTVTVVEVTYKMINHPIHSEIRTHTTVTSLDNDGEGSLREAVNNATSPTTITFETSGTIDLTSKLILDKNDIIIEGHSDGTIIRGDRVLVKAEDITLKNLELRSGTKRLVSGDDLDPSDNDSLSIGDGAKRVHIKNSSISWAVDENLEIWSTDDKVWIEDIIIENCIIAEAIYSYDGFNNDHIGHSMGILIGQYARRIAIINNLFANNDDRNPLANFNSTDILIANNFIYATRNNIETNAINISRGLDSSMNIIDYSDTPLHISIIGNYLEESNERDENGNLKTDYKHTLVHIPEEVNYNLNSKIFLEDNTNGVIINNAKDPIISKINTLAVLGYNLYDSSLVKDYVMKNAGANIDNRNENDIRILKYIGENIGYIISSEENIND